MSSATSVTPNLFIVGAAKAGTTSVYEYLRRHPQVFMAREKEPHFYSQVQPSREKAGFFNHVSDAATYARLFVDAGDRRLIGEASTSYLWSPVAAQAIAAASPNARIIIMLREPVSRAFSHYLNDVREGVERRSFLQAVEDDLAEEHPAWGVSGLYVQLGLYCDQVRRYLSSFGSAQCLVVFFEEFVQNPAKCMAEIFNFLNIEHLVVEPRRENPYAEANLLGRAFLQSASARIWARRFLPRRLRMLGRKISLRAAPKPTMDARAADLLSVVYEGQADCLERLLGTPVPWSKGRGHQA